MSISRGKAKVANCQIRPELYCSATKVKNVESSVAHPGQIFDPVSGKGIFNSGTGFLI